MEDLSMLIRFDIDDPRADRRARRLSRCAAVLPDFIHVLAFSQRDSPEDLDFGIVVIRGVLWGFQRCRRSFGSDLTRSHTVSGRELLLVPSGTIGIQRDAAIEVQFRPGRGWRCVKCRSHRGLMDSTSCDHAETARLLSLWDESFGPVE
jgi:hypothetical protein